MYKNIWDDPAALLPTSNCCAGVNIKYPFGLDRVPRGSSVLVSDFLSSSLTTFATSSLAILIADGGTILLNVPSGSGNNSSKAVFGACLKYFRIDINTKINSTENTDCGCM